MTHKYTTYALQEIIDKVNDLYGTNYSFRRFGNNRYEVVGKPIIRIGSYTTNELHSFFSGLYKAKTELVDADIE